MRVLKGVLLTCVGVLTMAAAQAPDPPLADTRLTVHTLVREDVFSGWTSNNLTRLSKAEQNIESLLQSRPSQRGNLLAWRGAIETYRAVVAHEAGKAGEFAPLFSKAREDFAAAAKETAGNEGVFAIIGGTLVTFADRLPAEHRAAAWSQAYDGYAILWKAQSPGLDQLPVHHKGELLTGLAQSAQRTGRTEETALYLDKILAVMPNTPYEAMARQWKADPATAATTNLTCKNCHSPGRLSARLAALAKQD